MYATGLHDEPDEEVQVEELSLDENPSLSGNSFFLWETHLPVWEIFNILRMYLTEFGGLDTRLLLRLIDERKLDLEETLWQIPYILTSYLSEKDIRTKAK